MGRRVAVGRCAVPPQSVDGTRLPTTLPSVAINRVLYESPRARRASGVLCPHLTGLGRDKARLEVRPDTDAPRSFSPLGAHTFTRVP